MRRPAFFFSLATVALAAALRRLIRGPLRPSWPFRFEVLVFVLRAAMLRTRLASLGAPSTLATRIPRSIASRLKLEKTTLAGRPAEIHTPDGWVPGEPTILYLHGGAYVTCSPATHRDLVSRIAVECGARCVVPDYRLAPAHPFPAAIDDALTGYRALLATGIEPRKLIIAGDSAGGGLTIATLLSLRDAGEPLPVAAVLLSPWVDLAGTGETLRTHRPYDYLAGEVAGAAKLYAGATPLSHPLVSPVYAELQGLPPLLVQSGGAELLLSENERFVERARAAGVRVLHEIEPDMVHVYQAFAGLARQGKTAIASIGRFIRECELSHG